MPNFICENPAVEKALVEQYEMIVEYGGDINDNVTVKEEQGELCVLSSLPQENQEELIIVPDACLPRTCDFIITAQDDKLIAEPITTDVTESHVLIMGLMMKIYNLTNKLAKHWERSPWLALQKSPAVMKKLYEARFEAPKIKEYYENYESSQFNKLLIDTFLESRTLGLKSGDEEKLSPCLMPFIDCINHNFFSPPFQIKNNNDGTRAISIINSVPISNSQECFVRYSLLDALDRFLLDGFIDPNEPFVRSVPLQFDLHELSTIKVQACLSQLYRGELPGPLNDLRMYLPFVMHGDDSLMQLSHLIIPGEYAPLALRRVLTFFIRGWKPGLRQTAVEKIVVNAEKLIIRENLEYYAGLSSVLEESGDSNVPPGIVQSIKTLVDIQVNKLRQYQERIHKRG